MSFLRHEEIYRPDVRLGQKLGAATRVAAPVLIGCDEFPVGYSLAGCPPAEPASASPTGDDSQQSTLPYNDFSANGNYPLNFVSQSKGALQTATPPSNYHRSGFDLGPGPARARSCEGKRWQGDAGTRERAREGSESRKASDLRTANTPELA
jgi:hypothetical protein